MNINLIKYLVYLGFLLLFPLQSIAQVTTVLGSNQCTIYPISLQNYDLNEQLMPLKKLFINKTIVGMGEATHGTKEFFEIKNAYFKWLVKECDFKVFGIEATYGGCCYINDYVHTGRGNIDSVMRYLDFWTWQTEEVRELILWIKNYNAQVDHMGKISFYGFDMQNFYSPLQYVEQFIRINIPTKYESFKLISLPILGKSELQIYKLLQNKKVKYEDSLKLTQQLLSNWILQNKSTLEKTVSFNKYRDLQMCLENVGQAIKCLSVNNISKFRDSCMAYNILQIQKNENKKMFIWAHNGHINLAYPEMEFESMGKLMGGHLKSIFGDEYYAIGFIFNEGSFQAIQGPESISGAIYTYLFARKKLYKGLKECTVPAYSKNTFTNEMAKTTYQSYFTDISKSENPIFTTLLNTYDVGSIFMNYRRCISSINAKRQFDGLIYVNTTNRAIPLKLKR